MPSTRPPLAIAFPPGLDGTSTRFWVLPHPRSGVPTYFAGARERVYEMVVTRPAAPAAQSWFLHGAGQVIADGAMHILSEIDPAFLLIGLFSAVEETAPRFWPLDDWVDAAADAQIQRRARSLGVSEDAWPDIHAFAMHDSTRSHFARVCAVQAHHGVQLYRLDWPRIFSLLDAKVARVCAQAKEPLEAHVWRTLEASASDAEVRAAQRNVAAQWIETYIPVDVAERWKAQRA